MVVVVACEIVKVPDWIVVLVVVLVCWTVKAIELTGVLEQQMVAVVC